AVDIAIAALDGNLGALAGFTGATLDGNGAVVNFGNFLLEQAHDEFGRSTGNDDAGALARLVHQANDAADTITHTVTFQARLFFLGKASFGLAQVEDVIGTFHAFYGAVHKLAGASGVFVVDGFTLGFAHLLEDHLLGGLCGDTSQKVG